VRDHAAAGAPVRVDAAILFSDIVVPLRIAGIGVEIVAAPARGGRAGAHAADVAALPTLELDAVPGRRGDPAADRRAGRRAVGTR